MVQSFINIPVPTMDFIALVDFLREKGSDRDPIEVVHEAISYWVDNASWKAEDLMPEIFERPKYRGYLWKSVLLPPSSKVRMQYKGETYHAHIEGDDFIFNSKSISPSEFANAVAGGTSRNAWRDLWIKRPQDKAFRSAEELRQETRKFSDPFGLLEDK